MEEIECKKCGKKIEGFSKKHVDWMLMQHELKHRNDNKEKEDE